MPEPFSLLPFQIDHIIAEKHRGLTEEANLAMSCERCNSHKGPNISGYLDQRHVPLFHPRKERWDDHFEWHGGVLKGKTDVGEVTIQVLNINPPNLLVLREALIEEGVFPPDLT